MNLLDTSLIFLDPSALGVDEPPTYIPGRKDPCMEYDSPNGLWTAFSLVARPVIDPSNLSGVLLSNKLNHLYHLIHDQVYAIHVYVGVENRSYISHWHAISLVVEGKYRRNLENKFGEESSISGIFPESILPWQKHIDHFYERSPLHPVCHTLLHGLKVKNWSNEGNIIFPFNDFG